MQNENILKMAEKADQEIKDVPTLNILICYLLYRTDRPIEAEQLYEIAISTGIVNYFYYQDSIDYLLTNGLISSEKKEDGKEYYNVQPKGIACAERLKTYVPKSCRDTLMLTALKYFARQKYEQEVEIAYIPVDGGCYVQIRCLDNKYDLMNMRLFTPDITQAQLIGEKIMLNPAGFYGKIISLALSNEEPEYDLTDN